MSGTQPPPVVVAGGKPPATPGKKLMIAVGVIIVFFVLYWLGGGVPGRQAAVSTDATTGAGMMRPIAMPPPAPPPAEMTPASFAVPPQQIQARRAAQPTQRPPVKASPIMAFESGGMEASPGLTRPGEQEGMGADGELATRLASTKTPSAKAKRLKNPTMTITMGTMIPCVRDTPVNTQLPGFVRCVVDQDIVGQQGNVTLINRGAKITGQIQNGVSHGQNRAFILWTQLENPDGVTVELGSPGTTREGENGIPLDINTNFWARFGGAIMLSFIDSGLQAVALGLSQAAHSGNGQSVNFNNLQGGGRSAATALNSTINIPPYGTSPQGMPEAVFVARNLDFSGVYDIQVVR